MKIRALFMQEAKRRRISSGYSGTGGRWFERRDEFALVGDE